VNEIQKNSKYIIAKMSFAHRLRHNTMQAYYAYHMHVKSALIMINVQNSSSLVVLCMVLGEL